MKIFDKWLQVKAVVGPGHTPDEIEEARRLFYAGATAAFEAIIKETDGISVEDQVRAIRAIDDELRLHRDELASGYKRKIN